VNEDGSPHLTAVGALCWTGASGSRPDRGPGRDSTSGATGCSIAVSIRNADFVAEGEAARVIDRATMTRIAKTWADHSWPAELEETGSGITAPFNAPSQGPPPWNGTGSSHTR
jgi:hypothetical protein